MRYLLFNKPYGVLTQFTADGDHPTLKNFVPVPGVYPVGRLDRDSEGLLLLTDDGLLQHRLSDPKFDHEKTYWVQVERIPSQDALKQLIDGVDIQGHRTLPAKAKLITPNIPPRNPPIRVRKNVPDSWIELVITEGRNRQVRHMTAAIGHPALRLIRIAIGPLKAGTLKPGEWRNITSVELTQLRQARHPNRT